MAMRGVCRRFPDGRDGPVEDRAGASMLGPSLEDLDGPERRERHGMRPGSETFALRPNRSMASSRIPGGRVPGRRRCQAPQGAAPAVTDAGLVLPAAVVTEAVTEPSVWRLGLGQEVEVAAPQGYQFLGWRRFPAHHDQAAGHVVDAVSVLVPGHDSLGVLEQADVVGQALQVPERHGRVAHTGVPALAPVSNDASSR